MSTPTSRAPRCPNHPPMSATLRCETCHMFLCRLCVKKDGARFFCAKCGMPCRVPSPEELDAALERQTLIHRRSSSQRTLGPSQSISSSVPLTGPVAQPAVAGSVPESVSAPPVEERPPAESQPLAATERAEGPQPPMPFSERKPPFYCKNHPAAKATRMCAPCQEFFCNTCAKMVADNPLCPDCAAQLKALSPEEQGVPPLALPERIGEALAYPLRGSGKVMLVLGAIFFWILTYTWRMSWIAGLPGMILALAFMYAYFARVCRTSASGREAPPDWPERSDFGTGLGFFAAKLLSVAPALLYLIFVPGLSIFAGLQSQTDNEAAPEDEEEVRYKAMAADKDLPAAFREASKKMVEARHPPKLERHMDFRLLLGHLAVALLLYAAGSYYLQMALLALVLHRSIEALNPVFVFSSIMRVRREYFLAYLVLIVTDIACFLARAYGESIFVVGPLIGAAIWLYLMMSQTYVLGRLYLLNQKRLNWFA